MYSWATLRRTLILDRHSASDSPLERAPPRKTTTAARRDGRGVAVEPVWLRGRQRRETRAADRRRPAGHLQPDAARRLHRAKAASIKAGHGRHDFDFEYSKFSGWPEIKESLMTGRIQAGVHAGAAGDGPGRQEDPGQDRLARPPLRRGDHGAHRFAVPAVRASWRASASPSRAASPSISCSCARCWRAKA